MATCSRCGSFDDAGAWSSERTVDGIRLLCARCTRDHVRDIEAKLPETWWES